jgi:hypothetical protein
MKIFTSVILLLLLAAPSLLAQDLLTRYADFGRMIVLPMATAPFPHPKRADGLTYNKKLYPKELHYNDSSVAVFIPKGFNEGKAIDLVVHFHGWFNIIDSTFAQFKLVEQFVASGKNALLVIPEGPKNAPDSFGGKLEDPNVFSTFVKELLGKLREQKIISHTRAGNIILSGHSGAYRVMSFILTRGGMTKQIPEVYLFDALYAQNENFTYYMLHDKGKVINIFTNNGGTKYDSEDMIEDLRAWNVPFFLGNDSTVTVKELKKNKIVFLTTNLEHNDVLAKRNQFEMFLKASCLKDIKKKHLNN